MFIIINILLKFIITWNTLCHNGKPNPAANFVRIIRARNEIKQHGERIASRYRNPPYRGARRSEIPQRQVNAQIAQFAQEEYRCPNDELSLAGGCVQRMIHMVSHVHGEQPVIRAILEEIPQRHRGMTEAMNEQCLE